MGEVVILDTVTRLDLPPERILKAAIEADLQGVMVMGFTKEGEFYAATTYADGGAVLWLMEVTRGKLMEWQHDPV